jgi:hypothetical protein
MRRLRQERLPRHAANGICQLVCVRIQPRDRMRRMNGYLCILLCVMVALGASPIRFKALKQIPKTADPLVIRTDFEHQQAWKTICRLIRQPVQVPGDTFYAHVEFLEDAEFRGLGEKDLLSRLPSDYNHSFLFVVDRTTVSHPDFPILVIDLYEIVAGLSEPSRLRFKASRIIFQSPTWISSNSPRKLTKTEYFGASQSPDGRLSLRYLNSSRQRSFE